MPLLFRPPPEDVQAAFASVAVLARDDADWLRWPRLSVAAAHPWAILDVDRLAASATLGDALYQTGWQAVGLADGRASALLRTIEAPVYGTSRTWNVPCGRRWGTIADALVAALARVDAGSVQSPASVVAADVPVLGISVLWVRSLGAVIPYEGLDEPWLSEGDFLVRVREGVAAIVPLPPSGEARRDPDAPAVRR